MGNKSGGKGYQNNRRTTDPSQGKHATDNLKNGTTPDNYKPQHAAKPYQGGHRKGD